MFSHKPGIIESIFFKNLDNMLPSDELTDEFLLQLPPPHSLTLLTDVETISKLTDELLLQLSAPHNQNLSMDDEETTSIVRYSF